MRPTLLIGAPTYVEDDGAPLAALVSPDDDRRGPAVLTMLRAMP